MIHMRKHKCDFSQMTHQLFSNVGHVPKDIITLVLAKITFTQTNIVYIDSRANVCLCLFPLMSCSQDGATV
jgi:hypothetical protein